MGHNHNYNRERQFIDTVLEKPLSSIMVGSCAYLAVSNLVNQIGNTIVKITKAHNSDEKNK